MLTAAPRIAKLLPRLASSHEAEVVATARAIERTLKASGQDWHDLAREIQYQPVPAGTNHAPRTRRERTSRTAPLSLEALRLLRAGLALDAFSAWERGFADTILAAASRPNWRPSRRQTDIIARLVGKATDAEAHP